jgi:hypothetical protein
MALTQKRAVQPPSRIGLKLDRKFYCLSKAIMRAMWLLIVGVFGQHSNPQPFG